MKTSLKRSILCGLWVSTMLGSSALLAQSGSPRTVGFGGHAMHGVWKPDSPTLIDKVRRAAGQYKDVAVATSQGWVPGTPCVSGPNGGAMGVHYVLPERLPDGALNPEEPEALIYEPVSGGGLRLVGVEFIVFAEDWAQKNDGAPSLDGHLLNYVGEPNRYGLPAFYELHVWAWQRNPTGTFADFNPLVSCDRQPGE